MLRRSLLAALGIATTPLVSGCTGPFFDSAAPRLGWVAVKNYSPEPRRFHIQVVRGQSVVHESTHEVEGTPENGTAGDVLECTWGSDPGPYALRGRVDGGEWVRRSVAEALDSYEATPDCVTAEAVYGRSDEESLAFGVSPGCEGVPTYEGGCSFANSTSGQVG